MRTFTVTTNHHGYERSFTVEGDVYFVDAETGTLFVEKRHHRKSQVAAFAPGWVSIEVTGEQSGEKDAPTDGAFIGYVKDGSK